MQTFVFNKVINRSVFKVIMGEFDLMLSFVSILFGIGYSKLLNAVPYVFSKNEKTSILYQLFFIYTFAAGIVHFWGFTNAIGNQDYNFNYFLCDVSLACFFYALCAFVSPSNFETINSWKEYFLKIRSKIWLCQILMVINKMLLVQFTMKDEALMNEVILVVIIPWFTISCFGFFVKNITTQYILTVVSLIHTGIAIFATALQDVSGLTS